MATDRWLGVFLLSICPYNMKTPELDEARALLEHYRDWIIESGIVDDRTPAHLRLYLLELVESGQHDSLQARRVHLRRARRHANSPGHLRDCALFEALEIALSAHGMPNVTPGTIEKFREAMLLPESVPDDEALQRGWTKLAGMMTRRCPYLAPLVQKLVEPVLPEVWADKKSELRYWAEWGDRYVEAWERDRSLRPSLDCGIKRLAEARLPGNIYRHARETAINACRLLKIHAERCVSEEGVSEDTLERDIEYAAHIHDWYLQIDPARMLTLATEWNLPVTGVEWANPKLLHGRLAVVVLKQVYGAEVELGANRFRRIAAMAENHTVGRAEATAIEKVFFLADALSDSAMRGRSRHLASVKQPNWQRLAEVAGRLDDAYAEAMLDKEQRARRAGHVVVETARPYLVQSADTHIPPESEADNDDESSGDMAPEAANR